MTKLRTKMLLFILVPTLLFFTGLTVYISMTVHNVAIQDAEEMLDANGVALANEIRLEFETALRSAQTVSQTFQGMISRASTPVREDAHIMLQEILINNPHYFGAWMVWEPEAFDGQDQRYANEAGQDETGRFLPYWSWKGRELYIEPLELEGEFLERVNTVLQSGEDTVFEPYWYEAAGQRLLMTSIVSPVVINGKTVGMTGVDLLLDDLNERIKQYTFYETGFAGLMSNSGLVLAHQNDDLIGDNYFDSDAMRNRADVGQVREAVRTGNKAIITGFSNALKQDVYRLFSPIQIGSMKEPWSAFLAAPINEVSDKAREVTMVIIIVSVIVILVLSAIIYFVTNTIVTPIRAAVELGQQMAEGDFTAEYPEHYAKRKDEIGNLGRGMNHIVTNLRSIIGKVKDSSDNVAATSEQIATASEEVANASNEQSVAAQNMSELVKELALSIQEVAKNAEQAANLSENTVHVAQEGSEVLHTSIDGMNAINEHITKLEEDSHKIGNIIEVIDEIAEQTNLLALNAAIEAAHAGEQGRGFAVVADEVRKLAERSGEATKEISLIIKGMQQNTDNSVKAVHEGVTKSKQTAEAFKKIEEMVVELSKKVLEIAAVCEEQSAQSNEVIHSIESIAAASEESAASAEESSAATQSLAELAEELQRVVAQFKV